MRKLWHRVTQGRTLCKYILNRAVLLLTLNCGTHKIWLQRSIFNCNSSPRSVKIEKDVLIWDREFFLFFFFFFFFCFLGHTHSIWKFLFSGLNWRLSFQPQPQQHRIQAASATYTTTHGNTRSLTHWASEPSPVWMLVRFANCWAHDRNSFFFFFFWQIFFYYVEPYRLENIVSINYAGCCW